MPITFDYDLGAFTPTFPGITLFYPNEDVWDECQKHKAFLVDIWAKDYRSKHGKEAPNLQAILEHVRDTLNYNIPLSDDQKMVAGQEILKSSPDNGFRFLCANSVTEHERRHFHDWLVSPYAMEDTSTRLEICLNGFQIYQYLLTQSSRSSVIPVPIPRWLEKSAEERQELIQLWQPMLEPGVEIHIPEITDKNILEAISNIQKRYRSLSAFYEIVGRVGLNVSSIFEASAIFVQTQAIHDIYGPDAQNLFVSNMAKQSPESLYPVILRLFSGLNRDGRVLENDAMLTLVTWCLLGGQLDEEMRHPVSRLAKVVSYLSDRGFPKNGTPAHEIFEELDRHSGAVSYSENLRHSVEISSMISGQMDFQFTSSERVPPFITDVLQAYDVLQDAHRRMIQVFLENPDSYANPISYLDDYLEYWIEPPERHVFSSPFHRVNRAKLESYLTPEVYPDHPFGDSVFLRSYCLAPPKEHIDIGIANNWNYACTLCDTLFAGFGRDHPDIDFHRESEKKKGIYLIELLD